MKVVKFLGIFIVIVAAAFALHWAFLLFEFLKRSLSNSLYYSCVGTKRGLLALSKEAHFLV